MLSLINKVDRLYRQYFRALLIGFPFFALGCGSKGPTRIAIDELHSDEKLEGKPFIVSGGKVERVHKNYVKVIDPGNKPDRVDLLCYFKDANGASVEKAFRGQGVTVTGRVVGPFDMWTFPTIKLDDCTFVLGDPPDASEEVVPATKGRGQVEAERDLKAGTLRIRIKHRPSGEPIWFKEYVRLLKEKGGIEVDVRPEGGPIAGLHPDDREYNEIVIAAIEKQHGVGIVEKLKKQAEGMK